MYVHNMYLSYFWCGSLNINLSLILFNFLKIFSINDDIILWVLFRICCWTSYFGIAVSSLAVNTVLFKDIIWFLCYDYHYLFQSYLRDYKNKFTWLLYFYYWIKLMLIFKKGNIFRHIFWAYYYRKILIGLIFQ